MSRRTGYLLLAGGIALLVAAVVLVVVAIDKHDTGDRAVPYSTSAPIRSTSEAATNRRVGECSPAPSCGPTPARERPNGRPWAIAAIGTGLVGVLLIGAGGLTLRRTTAAVPTDNTSS